MQLVEVVEHILATGLLPMSVERKMQKLLDKNSIGEMEMAAIDQLIEALRNGSVQPIA